MVEHGRRLGCGVDSEACVLVCWMLVLLLALADGPELSVPRDLHRGEMLHTWLLWDGAVWRLSAGHPHACAQSEVAWDNGPPEAPAPGEPRLRYATVEVTRNAHWSQRRHRYRRPVVAHYVDFRETPWPGITWESSASQATSDGVGPLQVGSIYRSHLLWEEGLKDWVVEGVDELGLVTGESLRWANAEALDGLEHLRQPVRFEVLDQTVERTIGRRCGQSASTLREVSVYRVRLL